MKYDPEKCAGWLEVRFNEDDFKKVREICEEVILGYMRGDLKNEESDWINRFCEDMEAS